MPKYMNTMAEVHRIRAELMEKYGGIAGWHKHNVEERPPPRGDDNPPSG